MDQAHKSKLNSLNNKVSSVVWFKWSPQLTTETAQLVKTEYRPDSGHQQYGPSPAMSTRGALPPTPPMQSESGFDGRQSPSALCTWLLLCTFFSLGHQQYGTSRSTSTRSSAKSLDAGNFSGLRSISLQWIAVHCFPSAVNELLLPKPDATNTTSVPNFRALLSKTSPSSTFSPTWYWN
jgi:hypothetical protein